MLASTVHIRKHRWELNLHTERPFIFYEVGGGAGGIFWSVIKKLHDPPVTKFFPMTPPPNKGIFFSKKIVNWTSYTYCTVTRYLFTIIKVLQFILQLHLSFLTIYYKNEKERKRLRRQQHRRRGRDWRWSAGRMNVLPVTSFLQDILQVPC